MSKLGKQINLYFDKVYGTKEESINNFKKICRRFGDLFPSFFFAAYESYTKGICEDSAQSKDFLCYIEHNLFHILKSNFSDSFNACSLDELCDFLKVFRLLNSTENIDVLDDFESQSYNNYKNASLSFFLPYLRYDSISVRQTFNREMKIPPDDVWHIINEKTFPKKQNPLPTLLQKPPLKTWHFREIEKEALNIVEENKLITEIDKTSFDFLLWYTYNILVSHNNNDFADEALDNGSELANFFGEEEGEHSNFILDDIFGYNANEDFRIKNSSEEIKKIASIFINKSEEERKKYTGKCSDCIMYFLKNNPDVLLREDASMMFFVLFNEYYFEKSKNSLLDLLTFGYIYTYMLLNDVDTFKNIPDKLKETCYNWRIKDSKSVYEIIDSICTLIDEYLIVIKEKNKHYNIKIELSFNSFVTEHFEKLTIDNMNLCLFPQVKRFFERSGKKHVTYADDLRSETATILTEQLDYNRKDLVEFLSDYKNRKNQQEEMKLLHNELTKIIPVISILNNLNIALLLIPNYRQGSSIKRLLNITDEFFIDYELEIFDNLSDYIRNEIAKHHKQENQVLKEINSKFSRLLKEDLSIDKIMELKHAWSKDIRSSGLDRETILNNEEMLCRIVSLIEDKASKSNGYEELYEITVNNLSDNLSKIKKLMQSVYSDKEFDDEIHKFFKSLSTGEYLYKTHILSAESTTERELFDYSCVALQYYTALEHVINFLFYYPYKEQVLKDILKKEKNIDEYIGNATQSHIFRRGRLKDSVELGTFSFIFSCLQKEPLCNYIANKIHIDPERLAKISADISKISKLRNNAAHGGNVLTKESAVEARQNVYEKSAEIASMCRELIPQIFALFDSKDI